MKLTKGAAIRLTILFILLGIGGAYSWQIMANPASLEQAEAQSKLLETIYVNGNYIEAFIWFCFAIGFAIDAVKKIRKNQNSSPDYHPSFFLIWLIRYCRSTNWRVVESLVAICLESFLWFIYDYFIVGLFTRSRL